MYIDVALYTLIILALLSGLIATRISAAALFFSALLTCYVAGFIDTTTLLHNFSNTGLVTLVLLILVSIALERTALLKHVSDRLFSASLKRTLFKVTSVTAITSAFLNNTAVVAALVGPIARNRYHAPSKLLIPLSYAAILGGTTTLIGTSTNLIVNSFVQEQAGFSLAMFSFLPIGLAVTLSGLICLFLTNRLLPETSRQVCNYKPYLVEVKVSDDSPLIGKSIEQNGLRNLDELFLAEIVRDGRLITPVKPHNKLHAGDKLIFTGDVSNLSLIQNLPGVTLFADSNGLLGSNLQEVIIAHTSNLAGATLKQASFRAKFDAAVVAIHRNGERLSGKLGSVRLRPGDRLMLACGPDFSNRQNLDKNFYFVTEHKVTKMQPKRVEWLSFGAFFATVIGAAAGLFSLIQGLLLLIAVLVATRVLEANEVKRRFPFELVIIIASALGLANSFSGAGVDSMLNQTLTQLNWLTPMVALILVYLMTVVLTELITNNAAAALMFPLGYGMAASFGVDIMPFAMAVAFGASAAFISPYSYQTNMIVMSAGSYKFNDFIRSGLLLSLVYGVVVLTLIPLIFPFKSTL